MSVRHRRRRRSLDTANAIGEPEDLVQLVHIAAGQRLAGRLQILNVCQEGLEVLGRGSRRQRPRADHVVATHARADAVCGRAPAVFQLSDERVGIIVGVRVVRDHDVRAVRDVGVVDAQLRRPAVGMVLMLQIFRAVETRLAAAGGGECDNVGWVIGGAGGDRPGGQKVLRIDERQLRPCGRDDREWGQPVLTLVRDCVGWQRQLGATRGVTIEPLVDNDCGEKGARGLVSGLSGLVVGSFG